MDTEPTQSTTGRRPYNLGRQPVVKEGLTVMIAGVRQRKDLKGKVGQEA